MINIPKVSVIIMAAGKGTRLGGQIPKPIILIQNESIVVKIINTASKLNPENIIVVIGHKSEEVRDHIIKYTKNLTNILFTKQDVLNGTLTAVDLGIKQISDDSNPVIILPSDNGWFLKQKTLERLIKTHVEEKAVVSLLLTKEFNDGLHKVEYKADKKRILGIRLRNNSEDKDIGYLAGTGILCIDKSFFKKNKHLVPQLPNGEYTVSRIIEIALNQFKVVAFTIVDKDEILTINTKKDLEYLRNLSI